MLTLLINKFNLNKEETIFFDDKEKNVVMANEVGIKAFVFNSIDSINRLFAFAKLYQIIVIFC